MPKCKVCQQDCTNVVKHYLEFHRDWLQKRAALEGQDVDSLSTVALTFIILGGMDLGSEPALGLVDS